MSKSDSSFEGKIGRLRALRYLLRADLYRYKGSHGLLLGIKAYLRYPGFRFTFWMRLAAFLHAHPCLAPVYWVAHLQGYRYEFKYGITIPIDTAVGPGLYIGHFGGIVINDEARIGRNCNLLQGVTIGVINRGKRKGCPQIGDCVFIGPGAKVLGNINVGSNVAIGANAVVIDDVADGVAVAGVPARIVSRRVAQGTSTGRITSNAGLAELNAGEWKGLGLATVETAGEQVLTTKPEAARASSRLPSLDGLRALSIGLVLVGHLEGTANFPQALYLGTLGNLGNLGVRVFFVISGFLITKLLLKEFATTGRISLKDFYMRRVLRIFPAAYTFMIAIALAVAFGMISLRPYDLVYAFTYTMNYHYDHAWPVGHLWSLAVEEQFYILWPFALFLASRRIAFGLAGGVLLAAPLVRLGIWYFLPSYEDCIGKAFPTVADALATGCLLAGLQGRLGTSKTYMRFLASRAFYIVPACLIVAHLLTVDHQRLGYLVGQTTQNVTIALCIDRWVRLPGGAIGRVLNSGPFVFIGTLSYSIYLWQQPFLNRGSDSILATFPLNLALVFLAAVVSFHLIENPFLKLRKYFHRTSPHAKREDTVARPSGVDPVLAEK